MQWAWKVQYCSRKLTLETWSSPRPRTTFCFPHQDLLSSDSIILYCNISSPRSSTFILCSKTKKLKREPTKMCPGERWGRLFQTDLFETSSLFHLCKLAISLWTISLEVVDHQVSLASWKDLPWLWKLSIFEDICVGFVIFQVVLIIIRVLRFTHYKRFK